MILSCLTSDFADISLQLQDVKPIGKKLVVEYRGDQYDVCFHGSNGDWGMQEADVACRQLGYLQGAVSTSKLNFSNSGIPKSFADFFCDGSRYS